MANWVAFVVLLTLLAACGDGHSAGPVENEPGHHSVPAGEHGDGPVHWGYGEGDGPALWADLSPEYGLCGSGREQSPVDLTGAVAGEQPPLTQSYRPAELWIVRQEHVGDVLDNGHTIQVNTDVGSTLTLGEAKYDLRQFHFHAPSEHTIDGRSFPMEMHLVHQSAGGELAVVGVLIDEGAENEAFVPILDNLPTEPGELLRVEHVSVQVDDLLPASLATYRYPGSLTTPPCSEEVSWLVTVDPIELSAQQIAAFRAVLPPNNRPVQALNDRTVVVDRVEG